MLQAVGTYQWMAPEVLSLCPYDVQADVYSYGIVLWEMTHLQIPYGDKTQDQLIRGVLKGLLYCRVSENDIEVIRHATSY